MWRKEIVVPESLVFTEYIYCLKIQKSVAFFFSKTDKVFDDHKRKIDSLNYTQRDIISTTAKPFQDKDKVSGIVAHVEDILGGLTDEVQSAFGEIDNLVFRNTANPTHWNKAFEELLDDKISKKKCFCLLHCMQKRYVTKELTLRKNCAINVWRQLQHSGLQSKKMYVPFFEEMFQIFKDSSPSTYSLLHFIKDGWAFLDIIAFHKCLRLELSKRFACDCKNSLSCLKEVMEIIFNQHADCEMLQDIVLKIFNAIPEKDFVDVLMIIKEIKTSDQNKNLQEIAQKHVYSNIQSKLSEKVRSFIRLNETKETISKAEGNLKSKLILHCENEILNQLRNESGSGSYLSKVECLFKEQIFFQNSEHQLLLLDALLKMPGKRPRSLIKCVLMGIEGSISKCQMETVGKAFDVLLETSDIKDVAETFKEFDVLVGKTDLQTCREKLEKNLKLHFSKISTTSVLLKIHQEVENLQKPTIECYCQILGERLRTSKFSLKCQYIEMYGKDISTRYAFIFLFFFQQCIVNSFGKNCKILLFRVVIPCNLNDFGDLLPWVCIIIRLLPLRFGKTVKINVFRISDFFRNSLIYMYS